MEMKVMVLYWAATPRVIAEFRSPCDIGLHTVHTAADGRQYGASQSLDGTVTAPVRRYPYNRIIR